MQDVKPLEIKKGCSVYFFIGDDLDALQAVERSMIYEVGNPDMATLNIARLNGRTDTPDELVKNIGLFPFGVEKRLVIYTNSLERIRDKKDIERWQKIVENVPPSTILVLEFPTNLVKKKEWMWKTYADNTWLAKWVERKDDRFYFKEFRIPSRRELPMRIMQMAVEEGGQIENRAADELARLAGDDILLIRQEVKKLCTYVNGERSITAEDVRLLCSTIPEEDVFAMVDAFALGDAPKALHHLKLMFANQDYVRVFSMIVRQFRLLLLAKEALQEGSAGSVAARIGESEFVAQKAIQQSKRFTFEELEHIYRALYDMDGDVKRGNITPEVGLELIFFEKTSRTTL
ncbi:MAG: DNA polymerase III subunit delta [Anaerolineaceae bacterium]